ncbi:MAG: T9SS type A sorting domain-containing protein [Flavobacteriales bacterium]|nr:T9SS type A sorting domain-containing protein [Flavobacteriales bacterium]
MRNTLHPFVVLMCITTSGALAQTPLQPLWSHTWPYGSGEPYATLTPGIDNHVSLDPISGNVFVSIDDQDQLFSQRWDVLLSFTPGGTEVTPDPIPLLGVQNDASYPDLNLENTRQMEVFAGAALQAHGHGAVIINGAGRSFLLRQDDGTTWQLSLGIGDFGADPTTSVLLDADGPVLGGSADGTTGWLCTVGDQGWPQWAHSYVGTHPIFDVLAVNGTLYAASHGTVLMVDRATGVLTGQIPISVSAYRMHLATDGEALYYAWSNTAGQHWGKRSLTGDVIWDQQATGDLDVTEMKVDALGRVWMSLNPWFPESGGRLLISTADGSAYEQFSYGASINDIELDSERAYLTGWSDTTTTGTYLIAVSAEMNVGNAHVERPSALTLGPNPACDVLNISSNMALRDMEILDAAGRTILRQVAGSRSIPIALLSPGAYWLNARTTDGAVLQRRFMVAR